MAANATSPPAEQASVSFCGAAIPCLWHDGQPFVAVRPIAEALGLTWHGQFERIKRDPVLSTSVRVIRTQIPGDDQARQIVALPFGLLNGWLFGISARRVRPELRDTLISYQREAYAVLFHHFYGKALDRLSPEAAPEDALPDSVINLLATRLFEAVADRLIHRPIPAGPRSPAVVSILSLPDGWLTFDPDDFKVVPGADYLVIGPDATLEVTPLLPAERVRCGWMVRPGRGVVCEYKYLVPIVGRVIRRVAL